MDARKREWGIWSNGGFVKPQYLTFTDIEAAKTIAARYRAAYPNWTFEVRERL